MALTYCHRAKRVKIVLGFASHAPGVKVSRWLIVVLGFESFYVEPASSVAAAGHSLARADSFGIDDLGLDIRCASL